MTLLETRSVCPLAVELHFPPHCNAVRPAHQSPVNPSNNAAATDSSPHTGARIASSTIVAADVFTNGFLWGRFATSPTVSQMAFSALGATGRSPLHHHDRKKPDYRFKSFAAFSPRILSFCFGVRSFRSRMVETVWGYSESKCGKSVAIKMWSSPTSFRDCVM
jgi:hypothetical protein